MLLCSSLSTCKSETGPRGCPGGVSEPMWSGQRRGAACGVTGPQARGAPVPGEGRRIGAGWQGAEPGHAALPGAGPGRRELSPRHSGGYGSAQDHGIGVGGMPSWGPMRGTRGAGSVGFAGARAPRNVDSQRQNSLLLLMQAKGRGRWPGAASSCHPNCIPLAGPLWGRGALGRSVLAGEGRFWPGSLLQLL